MSPDLEPLSHLLPLRTETYVGDRTDSRRWDHYQPRADDIFICTPPKCGTTWTQAICALLVFQRTDFEGQLAHVSPWFDGYAADFDKGRAILAAQTHRRFIKTHTPLDGIPYQPSSQYLIVYRDPRDAYFSMRRHIANLRKTTLPPAMQEDPRKGFAAWVEAPFEPGVGEQRSLSAFAKHYQSFVAFKHLPNFHFYHFADLRRDLEGNFASIAADLGIDLADEKLTELAGAATFEHMKSNPATFAPAFGMGVWKDDTAFFHSGQNAQWRDILEPADVERYSKRIHALLPAEDVRWLEQGGTT